jgi:hypothetical protein
MRKRRLRDTLSAKQPKELPMVTELKAPPRHRTVSAERRLSPTPPAPALSRHWAWLAAGLPVAFAIPFLFTDVVSVQRDVYYGIYGAAVLLFLGLWARSTHLDTAAVLRRKWRWAVVLGILFGGVMAFIVLREPATAHPHGLAFAGAITWRGLFYGAIDGLFLSSFPILATFAAFSATPLKERTRRAVAGIGALALALSLAFTAVYHLGYSDFRGPKLKKPVAGDVIWSAPTLLTLNPIGAPIAHVVQHVTAVTHSYDTKTFLPPHR